MSENIDRKGNYNPEVSTSCAKVFVSYSSRDREAAEKLCNALEERGIPCWMAPRDVTPGSDWDEAIVDAIDESVAMVLVLSGSSNESVHVKHEVERAVSKGNAVFPVRIADVLPSKKLALHISTRHWVDLWVPPMEPALDRLAGAIGQLLRVEPNRPNQQAETYRLVEHDELVSYSEQSRPPRAIIDSPIEPNPMLPRPEQDQLTEIATPETGQPPPPVLTQSVFGGRDQSTFISKMHEAAGPAAYSNAAVPGTIVRLGRRLGQAFSEMIPINAPSRGEVEKAVAGALEQMTVTRVQRMWEWYLCDTNSRRVFTTLRSTLGPAAEPVLREVLKTLVVDQEPMTRWKAMRLLLYLGTDDADLVRRYWMLEPDWTLREIVLEASEQLPKEKGLALLSEIAQADDGDMPRAAALKKLLKVAGTDCPEHIVPAVESGLSDRSEFVRAKALCAAVDLDKQYAVDFARNALSQEISNDELLNAVAETLGNHGNLDDLTRLGAAYSRKRFNECSFNKSIKRLVERYGSDAVLARANKLPDIVSREAACKAVTSGTGT